MRFLRNEDADRKLEHHCEDLWTQNDSDWSRWRASLPRISRMYRGILPERKPPFEDSSNLNIPVMEIATDRTQATWLSLLDDPTGTFNVYPTADSSVQQALNIQNYLNVVAITEMELAFRCPPWFHRAILYGMACGIVRWSHRVEKITEPFFVPKSEIKRPTVSKLARYQFKDLLVRVEGEKVTFRDDGRERTGTLTILRDDERFDPRDDEIEYEFERPVVTQDGPRLDLPACEDLTPSADSADPRKARHWFYNQWMTMEEVEALVGTGELTISDEDMKSLTDGSAKMQGTGEPAQPSVQINNQVATQSARRRDRILCKWVITWYDYDGDGLLERVVVRMIEMPSGMRKLCAVHPYGRYFPGITDACIPLAFKFLDDSMEPRGVGQEIDGIQVETNTLHNQGIDNGTLRNRLAVSGFYNQGSNMAADLIRVNLGSLTPVPQTAGLLFPNLPVNSGFEIQALQLMNGYADELIPHGGVTTGQNPSGVRTTGAVAILSQQAERTWAPSVRRAGFALAHVGRNAIALMAAFGPRWKEFRITGTNELVKLDREGVRGQYDYAVFESALVANKELSRSWAALRFQAMSPSPIMQSPERQYALAEDFLRSQDKRNIEYYLGPRPAKLDYPYYSPETEFEAMARGIHIKPHADEDLQGHMEVHTMQLSDPLTHMIPGLHALLTTHMAETSSLLSSQQRAAQQQAMGVAPAGTSGNPLNPMGPMGGMAPVLNAAQQGPEGQLEAAGYGG